VVESSTDRRRLPQWAYRLRLRRPGDGRAAVAATLLAALVTLVVAMALIARTSTWTWRPMIVLASGAHQAFWFAPLAVVLFAVVRRWNSVVLAAALTLLAAWSQLPLYVGADQGHHTGPQLRILQANLRVGSADAATVVRLVYRDDIDIAMTEELTPEERDRLVAAGMAQRLPYLFDASIPGGGAGLAIWSRFPLQNEVNHGGFAHGVLSADVVVGGRTATVVAAHVLPPYPYPSVKWSREMTRLRDLLVSLASRGHPVLLGGDLNSTVDNRQFRDLLVQGFRDGAQQDGSGYLVTYPTDRPFPPVIAIDHVLVRDAAVSHLRSVALPGSDHRGLVATVRL
jgi:endonuclease/exonuclease/phosphatase (EEP) superfamily protein YafD